MKIFPILAFTLATLITSSTNAADTPMQCNLTCKTDYTTSADMQTNAEPESDAANPLAPAKPESVMYAGDQPKVDDLIAAQNGSTGGFDFVTECVQYQGKIWAWREGKCKSMSTDWKSPGIGKFIQQ